MIVEKRLEHLLPAHEQLIAREIFSESETKKILQKRRAFEYSLLSHNATVDSFLDYIKYEGCLIELVAKRKIQKNIDASDRLLADSLFPSHIHNLFIRATSIFTSDIDLWEMYLDFCQSTRSQKSIEDAFAHFLRFHSLNPRSWIKASKYAIFVSHDYNNAIKLLDDAIKNIPSCIDLYLLYVEALLAFAKVIQQRRELHGIEQEGDITRAPAAVFSLGLTQCSDVRSLVGSVLNLFEKYEADKTRIIQIIEDSDNGEALEAFIQTSPDQEKEYKRLIEKTLNRRLKLFFVDFLFKQKKGEMMFNVIQSIDNPTEEELSNFCHKLFRLGLINEAEQICSNVCDEMIKVLILFYRLPSADKFIEATMKFCSDKLLCTKILLLIAQKNISPEKWVEVVDLYSRNIDLEEAGNIVDFTFLQYGYDVAKQIIDIFFQRITPTLSFIKSAIKILCSRNVVDLNEIRVLFESAVVKFSSNLDVWLDYCDFEFNQRAWKRLESVRNRATRVLKNASEFTREFQNKFCQNKDIKK